MADTTIKKYNSTNQQWEDVNPQTTHTQIVASGTPGSGNFLRGDGSWSNHLTGDLQLGDVANDNFTKVEHLTADGLGFDFEYNNASSIQNLQGSTNQALVLGDVDGSTASTLLGASILSGSTWTKKLNLLGTGELYIGSTGTDQVWHNGIFEPIVDNLDVLPTYGASNEDFIKYNTTERAIELQSSTDTSFGATFPAIKTESGVSWKISFSIKASASATSGVYFRPQEYDGALPDGKTHIGNSASHSAVQEDTRQRTSFLENQAIGTDWEQHSFFYTPTSTTSWFSLMFLNWTGLGTNSLFIKNLRVFAIQEDSADANTLDGINSTQFLRSDESDTMAGQLQISHNAENHLNINSSTTAGAIHFRESGTLRGIFGFTNGSAIYNGSGDNDMVWRAEANAHIVSNTSTHGLSIVSGRVGIGTTSPGTGHKLDVNGKIRSNTEMVATKFVDYNNGNYYADPSGTSIVNIVQAGLNTSHRTQLKPNDLSFNRNGTSYINQLGTGDIAFRFGSSSTERMRIENSGNVDVSGNISASDGRAVLRDNSLENHATNSNSTIAVNYYGYNSGVTQFRDFNIYDGKANLVATFDGSTKNATFSNDVTIQGDLNVSGSFTTIDTNTSTTEQWSVTNDGTGPAVIINQKGSQPVMRVQDDDTTVFEIVDGGNTHISNGKELTFLMNGQSYGSSLYVDSSNNTLLNARGGSGKTLTLRTYSGSGWNTGLVMNDAGDVGIGTTSPGTNLDVNGNIMANTYYDRNNSSYYVNPASTSIMNALNVQRLEVEGAIFDVENDQLRMPFVKGGYYTSGSGSVTGAIQIELPSGTHGNYTMMSFFVDIYDYAGDTDGESITLHIGGYNTGSNWRNVFANVVSGRTDRFFTVRFNVNTLANLIYIGETTSTWSYPKIQIRDFMAGHSGADDADWYNNAFSISIQSSFTGTTDKTKNLETVASNSLQLGGIDATNYLRSDAADNMSADLTFTTNANINFDRTSYLTLYGGGSEYHSIGSRNASGGIDDDIRANSFGGFIVNLDSNSNNSSGADFRIGRHGGTGTISDWLFKVDGESGDVGIGTTSPATKMHIVESGTATALTVQNASSNGTVVKLTSTGDNRNLYLQTDHIYSNGALYIGDNSYDTIIRGSIVKYDTPNLYLNNNNSPANTDISIYFGDDESDTAHRIYFDDSSQKFITSNELFVNGHITTTNDLISEGNLYLNRDNSPTGADAVIYFGDDTADTAHYLNFDNSIQRFVFSNAVETVGSLITRHNLYLNYDRSPAGEDPKIYFGDDNSNSAHYISFDNSAQTFALTNRIVGTAGRLGAIEYNGSDVDKVNFALSGSTLTITTS